MAEYEILLSGDCTHICRAMGWILEDKGYRVRTAPSPEDATEALVTRYYDLLIYVLILEDYEGIEFIKRAKKLSPGIKVILVTINQQGTFPLEADQIKVDDYLVMPCTPGELCRRVGRCLEALENQDAKDSEVAFLNDINAWAMNRLMTIFHDIRGAMVSISAVLKLIARGTYGEMDREVADKLQEVSARIKKLIGITEEFMSKALLGNGNEETEGETWDLRQEIMGPVVDEFSEEVNDYQITIDNRLNSFPAPTIPVKGSKFWLKSVFRNLLSNAIKYGGPGCAIMIDLEDRGSSYRLSVTNNGQPIPEERRALLFSRFSRVGNREQKKINGLGLYLSRDIIKRHGGDIWYEAINGGSNFVVALPRN